MKTPAHWKKLSAHRLYRKSEALHMKAERLQDLAEQAHSMAYAKGERARKAAFKRLPPEEQKRRLDVERFANKDADRIIGRIAAQFSAISPFMDLSLKRSAIAE